MSLYSNFSLSSKRSEVICSKRRKKTRFLSPHCVWRPIATQPPRVSSSTLYRLKGESVGYIFAPIVCVYLLSNFRGGLRKTHDRRRAVRFDPSRSSEVDDFRVIWKGLCDFLINSCWCTNVGMVRLRLICRHTAFQRHHTTVGVTFALPYLDNSLFHARRRTTVIAASLLAVRLYGTVCQLHFD